MLYPTEADEEYTREGVQLQPASAVGERAGVAHLVHSWHQQGHKVRNSLFFIPLMTIK